MCFVAGGVDPYRPYDGGGHHGPSIAFYLAFYRQGFSNDGTKTKVVCGPYSKYTAYRGGDQRGQDEWSRGSRTPALTLSAVDA